jgi:hypothetical protein
MVVLIAAQREYFRQKNLIAIAGMDMDIIAFAN